MDHILIDLNCIQGISNALAKLSNLTRLDTQLNTQVTNSLLETALSLTYRSIYLVCYDTGLDMTKFVYEHGSAATRTELTERDCCLYECGNIKFEAFAPKRVKSLRAEVEAWRDNGLYYIGSPLGSDDEYEDEFYLNHEDEEDDGFDDFINNEETEMLNELDT